MLSQGSVFAACRKLAESQHLDPLPGTLLNLAACHEREGRYASALSEFQVARALAERDHRDERVAFADEHLAAVAPKVSRIAIALGPSTATTGLVIVFDGAAIEPESFGSPMPVDPGEHLIEASAPGKRTWRLSMHVEGPGVKQTATIPVLDDVVVVPPQPPPIIAPPPPPRDEVPTDTLSTQRKLAIGSAAISVVSVGLGSYFGIRAISKHNDVDGICRTIPCADESTSINDDAKRSANYSTASFIVAAVALGGAALLWLTDHPMIETPRAR